MSPASLITVHEPIFGEAGRPFSECHASTLVRLTDGEFLVAFFAGNKEGRDDVAIYLVSGAPGRWSVPRRVAKVAELPHWNPVLHLADDGWVHLFFKVGKNPEQWQTWTTSSTDGGRSWSPARELVPGDRGGRGPVKNKLLRLADGTWLAGASLEGGERWDAFVDRSIDRGETWEASLLLPIDRTQITGKGVIQPTLWESAPGSVHMLLRSSCGRICRSDSRDGSRTWSPIYMTTLPNNNSGIDLVCLPGGTLLLAYNPVSVNWGPRHPLTLATSADNGMTWLHCLDLETEVGEFSYPAVIAWEEYIAVTYTWRRRLIAFFQTTVTNLLSQEGRKNHSSGSLDRI